MPETPDAPTPREVALDLILTWVTSGLEVTYPKVMTPIVIPAVVGAFTHVGVTSEEVAAATKRLIEKDNLNRALHRPAAQR